MTQDDGGGRPAGGDGPPALRTVGLGRRYGHVWALRDCSLTVPAGAVAGLVGPNGAGKTTLLQMIIGLLQPTEGQLEVFGETSRANSAEALARVSYVAQDYRDFTVADMFHLGRAMNPGWDQGVATARTDALGIPLKRKIKGLSGGQQAQVSLAMALAKRAPLLALDEPVSSLDPIARLDFMREVMAAAAGEHDQPVAQPLQLRDHVRRDDHGDAGVGGRVQLAGPVDDLLAAHRLLTVPRATRDAELPGLLIHRDDSDRHSTVLVCTDPAQPAASERPGWAVDPVGFEQLVLAYLQRPAGAATGDPAQAATRPTAATKEVTR
jgi:ABC-2 type transport system ATP-binding protein